MKTPAQDSKVICTTCGTRYAANPPHICRVCADDRQYVKESGQEWTSLSEMKKAHSVVFKQLMEDVYALQIIPSFAIAQRALFVISPSGNILWDCIPFIDEVAVSFIRSRGGIKGIAISHPHFYSLMMEWAETFDCPVYLHADDEQWIMDIKNDRLRLFSEKEFELWDGIKLVHTGGHFPGSTVMHLPQHGREGSLLTGDSIYVARDRKQVTCMYSYPNLIPLPKGDITYITQQVSPLAFDTMFGAFEWMNIYTGAKDIFKKSMRRYLSIFD